MVFQPDVVDCWLKKDPYVLTNMELFVKFDYLKNHVIFEHISKNTRLEQKHTRSFGERKRISAIKRMIDFDMLGWKHNKEVDGLLEGDPHGRG